MWWWDGYDGLRCKSVGICKNVWWKMWWGLIKMDRDDIMFVGIKCVEEVPPGLCSDDKSVHWVSIVCQK